MPNLVRPQVYLLGYTTLDWQGLSSYLRDSDQEGFWHELNLAQQEGVPPGEALCSLYAKVCYQSLVAGKNANITRTRSIADNLRHCWQVGHSSVFEHCQLNFLARNCSRVFTHEQVRHRAGFAYSQTSGRYCRVDQIDLVVPDELAPVWPLWSETLQQLERVVYLTECYLQLRCPHPEYPNLTPEESWEEPTKHWQPNESMPMAQRKVLTSAVRRILPQGQANELGFSCNLRALRHVVQMRTHRSAEWEMRVIWNQVYQIVREKFPLLFADANVEVIDGLLEVSGMRLQPYGAEPSAG